MKLNSESRKENDYWDIGLMKLLKGMDTTDILGLEPSPFRTESSGGVNDRADFYPDSYGCVMQLITSAWTPTASAPRSDPI